MIATNESALREQGAGVRQGGTCNTDGIALPSESQAFSYSLGHHIADAAPAQQVAPTWDAFVAVFDAPDADRSATKGGRYLCGPMNGGRRLEENAAPANWIAFDFDKLPSAAHRDRLASFFAAIARCVWYPTASSTPSAPRIRVVAALDRVATGAERRQLAASIGVLLGDEFPRDTNQDRPSQPLFLPLRGVPVHRCDTAAPLSVDGYLAFAPPPSPGSGAATQGLSDGPVPEWRGPTDDDELIRRALASKSAAAAFGDRASFADLWNANEEALGRAYPDGGGRPYDASSADAALASHLAFWTGRDGERIARLMRQSALVRDKWDREDYLPRTVGAVVSKGGAVLQDKATAHDGIAPPPGEPFRMVDLSREFEDAPPPSFVWEGLIPNGVVSILGGHGGSGKSYIALMLAVSVATGRPLYGRQVRQSNVLFYSGEDSAEILTHRLGIVCRGLGIARQELQGRLHIVDASHSDPTLFRDNRGAAATTPAFDSLRQLVDTSEIGLLVVDNASETFDASEIERAKVRAFMRNLKSMVEARNGAVLLLAHIDKNTARMGGTEGYSGSTAWHNSARSRLALKRDGGVLVIEHQKSNFGPLVEPIRLTWATGSIPMEGEDMVPASESGGDDTASVLRLIHEAAKLGNYCATSPQSPSNVPRVIGDLQGYPRRRKPREIFTLLKHAEQQGLIAKESYRDVSRKPKARWVLTASGIALIQSAPTAPTAPTYQHGAVIPLSARGAPSAPSARGGCGGWSAHTYSHQTS